MNNLTKLPLVQYSGMDYDNVIEDIKNIIKENPKWSENWGQFYESDAGVFLTGIMAYIADHLSTRLDYSINEHFISTASQDKNKLKLLKMINYNPTLALASSIKVKLELESTLDGKLIFTPERNSKDAVTERSGKIMSISATDIYGNSINFEAIPYNKETGKYEYFSEYSVVVSSEIATYETDEEGNALTLHQGKTKQTSFTSNETDGVFFDLSDKNIIQDSIRIYDRSTKEELLNVKSFIKKEALDESYSIPFVVSKNEDETIRISFANAKILTSEKRRYSAGSTIDVFYRVGGGASGNIPSRFLNRTIKVPEENGGMVNVLIYNETAGTGGIDAETADEAVVNGPLSIRTAEKAVTPEDYDIILGNYANLLKVKTYSSVNAPTTFKSKYGRYLNPQEVFSFVLLNKEHGNVPSSKFNLFPWFELIKENRFNEKYTFSTSAFNSAVETTALGKKLTLIQPSGIPKLFTNFMAIETDSEIKNNLYINDDDGNVIINSNLIVKAMKEQASSLYFSDMPFSLVYDPTDPNYSETLSKQKYLNVNNQVVTNNVHAKYVSNKWIEEGEAIDIKPYGNMGLVLDDKGLITINLQANLSTEEKAKTKIFRYLTNSAPTAIPSGYVWQGIASEAQYRFGIIETINSQVGSNDLYNSYTSLQYIGAGADSPTKVLPDFTTALLDDVAPMIFSYNENIYRITFSPGIFDLAKLTLSAEEQLIATKDNIIGITAMINYLLADGIEIYDENTSDWSTTPVTLPNIGFNYELVKRYVPNGNENEYDYTSSIDMFFYSKNISGLLSGTSYISIGYDPIGVEESLLHNLASISVNEYPNVSSFLPTVIEAGDYEAIASVIEKQTTNISGNLTVGQFLQIKSPLIGETSTIYFVNLTTVNENDFMRDLYLVKYISETGSTTDFSITSNKAKGIKKATLLIEDQTVGYYDGELISPYKAGTIIYEHNCINNVLDMGSTIYYTYKVDNNKELVIGSVYDNFYYTGDADVDETFKSNVSGLLGQSIKTTYDSLNNELKEVDFDKSNFIVKFTNDIQNTTSIYSITSNLDVVENNRVLIKTDEIINFSAEDVASLFSFSVDDMITPITVSAGSITSSDVLYELIQYALTERTSSDEEARDYSSFVDDIIRYDYDTKKILCFGNIDKTENGCVKFYKDDTSTTQQNIDLYRNLFGTNLTNNYLYNLYEADIPVANRYIINETTGEYCFYPTSSVEPLTFIYKTYINGTPRYGDYYINKHVVYNSNQTTTINYILTKTNNSIFQDSSFYLHFVNDRTYDSYVTEEHALKKYLKNYIISGMETTFATPYIKTFDIKAKIYFNSSFSESEIRSAIETKIASNYGIDNSNIGQKIKKSSLYRDIVTVDGVTGVDIDYFGLDASIGTGNVAHEISTAFDEILVIHEDETDSSGTKVRGMIFTYEEDE